MNRNTKLTGIAVLIVVILGGWYLAKGEPADTGPIKIGFIGPLTGDAASIGESTRNAVVMAIDEVNAEGGRQYEVIYEDGKCAGPASASAAQKLIHVDKVEFIIGGICSGETLGAAPIAEAAGVVLLSPVSSSPDITNAGDFVFRVFASDATSGSKMAETTWKRGHKNVAVISEQTDYSQALRKVFEERFKELGGTIVISEGYPSSAKDFRSQLAKIKATNPDAIYLVPQTPASGEVLLAQVKESGITTPLFSNELVTTESFLTSGVSEGILFAEVNFDKESPEASMFLKKFAGRFGDINANTPPVYVASTYDAVHLLTDLIEEHGTNPKRVRDALYKVSDRPGAAGPLLIDENGDAVREYVLKQIQGGEIVPITN